MSISRTEPGGPVLSLYFMLSGDYMPWWIYPYIFWCFFGSTIIHIICSIVSLFVFPSVSRVNIDWPPYLIHTLSVSLSVPVTSTPCNPLLHTISLSLYQQPSLRRVCLTKSSSDCNVVHKVEQEWDHEISESRVYRTTAAAALRFIRYSIV